MRICVCLDCSQSDWTRYSNSIANRQNQKNFFKNDQFQVRFILIFNIWFLVNIVIEIDRFEIVLLLLLLFCWYRIGWDARRTPVGMDCYLFVCWIAAIDYDWSRSTDDQLKTGKRRRSSLTYGLTVTKLLVAPFFFFSTEVTWSSKWYRIPFPGVYSIPVFWRAEFFPFGRW